MLIYHQLTREFNQDRTRAIICGGQAVVLHRLAITSKDGGWIVRETEADLAHIRGILAQHGARYRFGAPLDGRWLAAGWSAHLEFHYQGIRARTDFFTRPPRLTPEQLAAMWTQADHETMPFVELKELALLKMTMREKDYPILGELARRLENIEDQLLLSRSARDLIRLANAHPEITKHLHASRPLLAEISAGEEVLATALDAERRSLIRADEARLSRYQQAVVPWEAAWPSLATAIANRPLSEAHEMMCAAAAHSLPTVI